MEGGRSFFEETVVKNLRLGRFLTLIVGDKIRQSVIEMLGYYGNKYPHLATDIALVELHCYRWAAKEESWPLLVVPNIVARTEIVERSVVQVTINPPATYQIESQQEKAKVEIEGRKRVTLTEEAFWELLKKQTPDDYDAIRNLIDKYRERDAIEIDPTEKGIAVRLYIQDTGQQAALFFVNTNAEVWVWPETVRRQLEKAGIDRNLAESYRTQIRHVFNLPEKRVEFGRPIRQVNVEKFTSAVDAFIQNIQVANQIND
jgi:G:T/U-mismatch repair DNA glycosylase